MKTNNFFIVVLLSVFQAALAQNDTLTGILLDIRDKPIKKYYVRLGRPPVSVKTDKAGIFSFPHANLNDTLFVADKKGRNEVTIPVNGYSFVAVKSLNGNFNTKYLSEPDEKIIQYVERQIQMNKKKNLTVLHKEDIEKSGCMDVSCLLRRFSGVTIGSNNNIQIRGTNSLQLSTGPLIVIDGIPTTDTSFLFNIPIEEIEEISVLKDASMYGVRGSNGAIVVITQM